MMYGGFEIEDHGPNKYIRVYVPLNQENIVCLKRYFNCGNRWFGKYVILPFLDIKEAKNFIDGFIKIKFNLDMKILLNE